MVTTADGVRRFISAKAEEAQRSEWAHARAQAVEKATRSRMPQWEMDDRDVSGVPGYSGGGRLTPQIVSSLVDGEDIFRAVNMLAHKGSTDAVDLSNAQLSALNHHRVCMLL